MEESRMTLGFLAWAIRRLVLSRWGGYEQSRVADWVRNSAGNC